MHFKLYTAVGARYPPKVDEKLEAAAAGITAIMQDIASAAAALPPPPQVPIRISVGQPLRH